MTEIKTHIQRASHLRRITVPLLTPEQEAVQELDLVPEEKWGGIAILPVHRKGEDKPNPQDRD